MKRTIVGLCDYNRQYLQEQQKYIRGKTGRLIAIPDLVDRAVKLAAEQKTCLL